MSNLLTHRPFDPGSEALQDLLRRVQALEDGAPDGAHAGPPSTATDDELMHLLQAFDDRIRRLEDTGTAAGPAGPDPRLDTLAQRVDLLEHRPDPEPAVDEGLADELAATRAEVADVSKRVNSLARHLVGIAQKAGYSFPKTP